MTSGTTVRSASMFRKAIATLTSWSTAQTAVSPTTEPGLHMQREEAIQAGGADLRSNPKRACARPLRFGTSVFYSRQII
jgi:hypothetical protein